MVFPFEVRKFTIKLIEVKIYQLKISSEPGVSTLQGVQGQIFMFQFALTDRNMQARFGLKVFWES